MGSQLPTNTHDPQAPTSTSTYLLHLLHNWILLMNSSACTFILLDMQLHKYLDFLNVRQKNDIFPVHLFSLRISAAHKLPTRVSYKLLQPASTHVGRIYPRLVGMRVQKGHLYYVLLWLCLKKGVGRWGGRGVGQDGIFFITARRLPDSAQKLPVTVYSVYSTSSVNAGTFIGMSRGMS